MLFRSVFPVEYAVRVIGQIGKAFLYVGHVADRDDSICNGTHTAQEIADVVVYDVLFVVG